MRGQPSIQPQNTVSRERDGATGQGTLLHKVLGGPSRELRCRDCSRGSVSWHRLVRSRDAIQGKYSQRSREVSMEEVALRRQEGRRGKTLGKLLTTRSLGR